ncbi:MAG: hypothetical protein B7Z73_11765, partial [Planctomycetia bacterium 21-64-5]
MLQRWMQAVITHPDGVAAGTASDEARQHVAAQSNDCEAVIGRSRALTSVERLSIYHNAYFARLLECMRSIYPMVARTVGDEAFDALAVGYLHACPSRSYTLDRLGDDFPRFLDETRPDRDEAGQPTEPWPDFLMELARLERAIGDVFDGPGTENKPTLNAEQLLAVDADLWPTLRLAPAPCLRTLAFRFPVNDYFTALRERTADADPPEFPPSAPSWLALSRRDFVVRRHALERPQYTLLTALVDGQTIGAAIEQIAADATIDFDTLAAQLRDWFHTWTA